MSFERVYVINLRRRVDRLTLFMKRLEAHGWPFARPIIYPAIEGDKVGVPPEFTQGGGAYGCRMSHLRILQDCLMEDVQSVLILEDDADITEGFPERVQEFLAKVPQDWEGIMLGGQHHAPPIDVGIPGVVRVRYCQRTHAYAARPSYMRALQRRWGNATVHIDWLMRDWQHQLKVYAPDPWLIGQAGGRSDIAGREKPPEWWTTSSSAISGPIAVAFVDHDVMERLRLRGCHTGQRRNVDGVDVGLQRVFRLSGDERIHALRQWIYMIQAESVAGLIPTIWHPEATMELVRDAWNGPVYELRGNTPDEAWACLPPDVRHKMETHQTLRQMPIVLLRCPGPMIRELHASGFHPGYWRDPASGLDRGLMHIFSEVPPERRCHELTKWCTLLTSQADRDGLIVAAIHPELTLGLLQQATSRPVREITANSVAELRRKVLATDD